MARPGRKRRNPPPTDRPWAMRIRAEREASGMSQEALAGKVGKSQSMLYEYEIGKAEPDIATLRRLADALGVSAAWLAFGEEYDRDGRDSAAAGGKEQDRLLSWALHRVAAMLADESLDSDLAFLQAYTRKLISSADGISNEAEAKEVVNRAIEAERLEFRQRKDDIRKDRL